YHHILDVGCGTGYLTGKLQNHWPQAQVMGLDFAIGMIEVARGKDAKIIWVVADGHQLPLKTAGFELVVSNLAYQWSGDLRQAFSEAQRVLTKKGFFAATLFGFNTGKELFLSLREAQCGIQVVRLPDFQEVKKALKCSGFNEYKAEQREIKIEFLNMPELLKWHKIIGANHLSSDGFLGPETLSRAADIYQKRFPYGQGVAATFEVIEVYAQK
ncbi:MAG: methyltransferase domain-containing protein, partial [Candidatus Omnitrophica bacterium]|nr:methyltransferase domain-containing protein [Candidatus Omnitrophota bacterium]